MATTVLLKEIVRHVGLDIEVNGRNLPGSVVKPNNQILSIGVCVYDVEIDAVKGNNLKLVAEEGCILKLPAMDQWEERCVKEFWSGMGKEELERIKAGQATALDERGAAEWVVAILKKYTLLVGRTVLCSDNPAFDFAWIENLVWRFLHYAPVAQYSVVVDGKYSAPLCLRSASQGILSARGRHVSGWWKLDKFLNVKHDHNPMHDAHSMLLRYLLLRYLM